MSLLFFLLICSRTMKASQEKALQEQSEARKEKARLAKEKKLQLLSSRWLEGRDDLRCQCTVFKYLQCYSKVLTQPLGECFLEDPGC